MHKPLVIDVREPFEYQYGHVEGAINIPPARLMSGASELSNIDRNMPIILYCISGSRSNSSMHFLRQMGFTNLTNGINKDHVLRLLADH